MLSHHDEMAGANLLTDLERIKWLLWHGNQHRARETIGFFMDDVDALQVDYPNLHKFARAAHEFGVYIAANTGSLINYWRAVPRRRAHILMPGRIHGERRDQQALRQTSADAVDQAWRTPVAPDAHAGTRRHSPATVRALVSGLGKRHCAQPSAARCGLKTPHASSCSPLSAQISLSISCSLR
jgi:hypothetical protein